LKRKEMSILNVCAFTGHRPKSFPWKYDETACDCVLLKEVLAAQLKALAEQGVTDFLSGELLEQTSEARRLYSASRRKIQR